MSDPLATPIAPMEAKLVAALPQEPGWQFEPKWDGFRTIAVRDGGTVVLWSKSGKPLQRYFPELVEMLGRISCDRFVVDGEIILAIGEMLSFDALQQRLHPAASRIARLARETPAQLMLFDALAIGDRDLADAPLSERRVALESFHARHGSAMLLLSPVSHHAAQGEAWLAASGGALDGVIAKPVDAPYRFGERAMRKVKQLRSADCVVGGFRHAASGDGVGSLLLGLYDDAGKLDHVGFTSGISAAERVTLAARLEPLRGGEGFTGKAPGGPEPLGDRAVERMGAAASRTGRGGDLRPGHCRPLSSWHAAAPLAARQGAGAVPARPAHPGTAPGGAGGNSVAASV